MTWLLLFALFIAAPAFAQDCLSPCAVTAGQPFTVATNYIQAQSYLLQVNGVIVAAQPIVRDSWTEFAVALPVGTHTLRIDSVGTQWGTLLSETGTVTVSAQESDTTPPVLTITRLRRTGRNVDVAAQASDTQSGVARIYIWIAQQLVKSCTSSTCSAKTHASTGQPIVVIAEDRAANRATVNRVVP